MDMMNLSLFIVHYLKHKALELKATTQTRTPIFFAKAFHISLTKKLCGRVGGLFSLNGTHLKQQRVSVFLLLQLLL